MRPYISGISNQGFTLYDLAQSASRLVIDLSGNVGIGTSSPAAKLDVAGDVSVASAGAFIGPPGMLLTHASFATALGYDSNSAYMLAGDGGMEAHTGTTSSSVDDTVGGVVDVTDLGKTADIATGLSRSGAFLSARLRWKSSLSSNHTVYILAGGANTSGALSSNGVKNGFGFKAVGSTLYGFTVSGGTANAVTLSPGVTLSQNVWVDLLAIRRGSYVYFYANGVAQGSTSSSLPSTAGSTYEVRTESTSTSDAVLQVAYLTVGMPF
ncbi:MAG: hypothetical protein HY649_12165 [Acidobacteria bacterium]|nr:hypothetical protein [Acidobacteriota bacterium]